MAPADKLAAIEAAAERLFARDGFGPTSIADIAADADVAVGTVYRFFQDKTALLARVRQRVEERFVHAMRAHWSSRLRYAERFAPMVAALLDEGEASRSVVSLLAMEPDAAASGPPGPGAGFTAAIAALYREGQAAGAYHPGDPDLAAAIAYGMVEGAMRFMMAGDWHERRSLAEPALVAAMNAAFLAREGQ